MTFQKFYTNNSLIILCLLLIVLVKATRGKKQRLACVWYQATVTTVPPSHLRIGNTFVVEFHLGAVALHVFGRHFLVFLSIFFGFGLPTSRNRLAKNGKEIRLVRFFARGLGLLFPFSEDLSSFVPKEKVVLCSD